MPNARESVEYIGGPLTGTSGQMDGLPETVARPDGRYERSVRCAEDGAMRYVWRSASRPGTGEQAEGAPFRAPDGRVIGND